MTRSVGPLLVGIGLVVIVIGVLAWSGGLTWFGRLPGDVRYERDSVRVFMPITSMLIASVVVTVVVNLVARILR